jgi:hypothetical protein
MIYGVSYVYLLISFKLMSNTAKAPLECGVVITETGSLKDIG